MDRRYLGAKQISVNQATPKAIRCNVLGVDGKRLMTIKTAKGLRMVRGGRAKLVHEFPMSVQLKHTALGERPEEDEKPEREAPVKLSVEDRVKQRLGKFWYFTDQETWQRIRQEIIAEDTRKWLPNKEE